MEDVRNYLDDAKRALESENHTEVFVNVDLALDAFENEIQAIEQMKVYRSRRDAQWCVVLVLVTIFTLCFASLLILAFHPI